MSLDTYQHVIDELEGAERVPADEQIRRARANLRPVSYPPSAARTSARRRRGRIPCTSQQADERIRTADPFITSICRGLTSPTRRGHERRALPCACGRSADAAMVGRFALRVV
jgi:hypothetical protein